MMKAQRIHPPMSMCGKCRTRHSAMFACPPVQLLQLLDPATDRIEELGQEDIANIDASICRQIAKETHE